MEPPDLSDGEAVAMAGGLEAREWRCERVAGGGGRRRQGRQPAVWDGGRRGRRWPPAERGGSGKLGYFHIFVSI